MPLRWTAYRVLVGNVPFEVAVLVTLAVAVASLVIGRVNGKPVETLETGSVATFSVLTILTFALSQPWASRWWRWSEC